MIELVSRDDVSPICPHCDSEIQSIWFRELTGVFGRRYIYFCGACNRVLGVSHRKGFFMG